MIFDKSPLLNKLKKKSGNVLFFEGGNIYAKNLTLSGNRRMGRIDVNNDFRKFLNKFGRRLFIADAVDRLFDESYFRWEIDFQLLYSGYLLSQENPAKFKEAVEKCRNKKEFLMVCGLR